MKKKLLLMLVMIFMTSVSMAQKPKFINFGIKLGANMSNVSGLADIKTSIKTGFTGGLSLELRPFKFIGFNVDALYSGDGFKSDGIKIGDRELASLNASLGYLDLPITARIYVAGGLSVNAGVMPSFLLSFKLKIGGESEKIFNTNKAAFSIPVGLSYRFGLGLIVEARYNIPLSDINKGFGTDYDLGYDLNMKRQAFSFMVGWTF